jgi:hypothetical protein
MSFKLSRALIVIGFKSLFEVCIGCLSQKLHSSALSHHDSKMKPSQQPGLGPSTDNKNMKRKSTNSSETESAKKVVFISTDEKEQQQGGMHVMGLSQARVDTLITDFIIEDMQSFAVVEQPSFVRLINGLQPTKKVIGRKAVVAGVEKRFEQLKERLTSELSSIQYVCTTADIWSAHNRIFFGITAHWINSDTLGRHSAALGCLRFRGRHTYDAIATILEQVHMKYGINGKVVLTVTDNGSNFIKAFKEFGKPLADTESDGQVAVAAVAAEDGSNSRDEEEQSSIVYVDIQAAIQETENSADSEYALPSHRPCASHTIKSNCNHRRS